MKNLFRILLALSVLASVVASPVKVAANNLDTTAQPSRRDDHKKTTGTTTPASADSSKSKGSSSASDSSPLTSKLTVPSGTTKLAEPKGDVCVKLADPATVGNGATGKATGERKSTGKSASASPPAKNPPTKGKSRRTSDEPVELAARQLIDLYHVSSAKSVKSIYRNGIDWRVLSVHRGDFHGRPGAGFYLGDHYTDTVNFCRVANRPCDAAMEYQFDEHTPGVSVYRFRHGKDGLWTAMINHFKYGQDVPHQYRREAQEIVDADVIIGPIDSPDHLVGAGFTQYCFKTERSLRALIPVGTYPEELMSRHCRIM